jgi:Ca2+-binding RTX toxin-like protein
VSLIIIAVNTATGGDATGDTISGFESNRSSSGDTLTGNNIVNTLDGGDGNDTIKGGAGADVLIGGIGTDTLSYAGGPWCYRKLAANTATGGEAAGDDLGLRSCHWQHFRGHTD